MITMIVVLMCLVWRKPSVSTWFSESCSVEERRKDNAVKESSGWVNLRNVFLAENIPWSLSYSAEDNAMPNQQARSLMSAPAETRRCWQIIVGQRSVPETLMFSLPIP